jgi:hypothetical protein
MKQTTSFKIGRVTLVGAVTLLGLGGACLSCLSEDETPAGSPGPIDPAQPGNPSSGGPPSGGQQPGDKTYDPSKPFGFWANTSGAYVYIWPNGNFVVGRPVWNKDGSFDEDASFEKNGRDQGGRIFASNPDPQQAGKYRHEVRFDNGKEEWASALSYPQLYWPMRYGLPERPIYIQAWVTPLRPANVTAVSGVYVRRWDHSTTASPGAGQYGVDIHASGLTVFEFKPGNRVYFRNNTHIATLTTIGVPGGSSTPSSLAGSNFDGTNVEGEGSYSIDGWFMTITFDNGDVLEDIFHTDNKTYVVFGNTWAELKK